MKYIFILPILFILYLIFIMCAQKYFTENKNKILKNCTHPSVKDKEKTFTCRDCKITYIILPLRFRK